jgi:Fe2+ transport system protein B
MRSNKLRVFWCIVLFLFLSNTITSQIQYPRFTTDSLGQKIIEMTIEQAQKLDNNSEMLELVKKLNSQMSESDSICLKVVSENEKVIALQKIQVSKLQESLLTKDEIIKTLQKEIKEHEIKEGILEKQVDNREETIKEKDKQISSMKRKLLFSRIAGGVITTGLLILILLTH